MAFNISDEMPEIIKQYALYYRNIKGRAQKTVDEYCMDLRTFFRFMKRRSIQYSSTNTVWICAHFSVL